MPGVKGRSGRKSKFNELQTYEVAEMSIKVVRDYLNSTVPLEKKVEVAKHFVLKAMPTRVEGEGFAQDIRTTFIIPETRKSRFGQDVKAVSI